MHIDLISKSPQQTFEAGKSFSKFMKGGDVLLFSGELGGGKTTFISGLAHGMKISQNLSSPSFTILSEYKGGKFKLIHIDLYRLDGAGEFENIGIDEYIYDNNCVICIEWGEKVREYIKKEYLMLEFEYILNGGGINMRKIVIKGYGLVWERRLKKLDRILRK